MVIFWAFEIIQRYSKCVDVKNKILIIKIKMKCEYKYEDMYFPQFYLPIHVFQYSIFYLFRQKVSKKSFIIYYYYCIYYICIKEMKFLNPKKCFRFLSCSLVIQQRCTQLLTMKQKYSPNVSVCTI